MKNYEKLKETIEAMESDFRKFYDNGNNAAGTRVRQGMQTVKSLAQDIRKEILGKRPKRL